MAAVTIVAIVMGLVLAFVFMAVIHLIQAGLYSLTNSIARRLK